MEKEPDIFDQNFCPGEFLQEIIMEIEHEGADVPIICNHLRLHDAIPTIGAAAAAGITIPMAAKACISAAGFTKSGISKGSPAAYVQGPQVASGSLFSTLQSVGAKGGPDIMGPVGIGAAAIAGGGMLLHRQRQNQLRKERIEKGTATLEEDLCKRCWIKMKLKKTLPLTRVIHTLPVQ